MINAQFDELVSKISSNYEAEEIFVTKPFGHFPNRDAIISIIKDVRSLVFPGYYAGEALKGVGAENYVAEQIMRIRNALRTQVHEAFLFRDGTTLPAQDIEANTDTVVDAFMAELPHVQELLFKDVQAAFDGDPAAQSKQEIILAYPGLFAIFVYRIAHILYDRKVPLIPRLMTEYAHSKTGVDINAGATIGEYFFIDHATGVVIGQTAEVGNDVVIFHGVTLGGVAMTPGKRHPTVGDHVMIGAGAKVLGPITVGTGVKIGANAVVVKDVPCGNVAIGVPARLLPKPEKDTRDRDLIVDPAYFFEEPALYI